MFSCKEGNKDKDIEFISQLNTQERSWFLPDTTERFMKRFVEIPKHEKVKNVKGIIVGVAILAGLFLSLKKLLK